MDRLEEEIIKALFKIVYSQTLFNCNLDCNLYLEHVFYSNRIIYVMYVYVYVGFFYKSIDYILIYDKSDFQSNFYK